MQQIIIVYSLSLFIREFQSFFCHILILSDRYNFRCTEPIRLIFGYVVQNVQMNLTSKNRAFPINTKGDMKNADISVRIGDFPEIFGYDVHLY